MKNIGKTIVKSKFIILSIFVALSALLLGMNTHDKKDISEIAKKAIESVILYKRKELDLAYPDFNEKVNSIELVCKNGQRYLFSVDYNFQNSEKYAVEFLYDEETEYLYINSFERYNSRFSDTCINLYE